MLTESTRAGLKLSLTSKVLHAVGVPHKTAAVVRFPLARDQDAVQPHFIGWQIGLHNGTDQFMQRVFLQRGVMFQDYDLDSKNELTRPVDAVYIARSRIVPKELREIAESVPRAK